MILLDVVILDLLVVRGRGGGLRVEATVVVFDEVMGRESSSSIAGRTSMMREEDELSDS